MAISEYEVENLFIERLGTIGYKYVELKTTPKLYLISKRNLKHSIKKKSLKAKAFPNCLPPSLTDFARRLKTKPFSSLRKFA